jgi:hypothetical protein
LLEVSVCGTGDQLQEKGSPAKLDVGTGLGEDGNVRTGEGPLETGPVLLQPLLGLGPAADDAGPGGRQDPLGPHAVLLLGHLLLTQHQLHCRKG